MEYWHTKPHSSRVCHPEKWGSPRPAPPCSRLGCWFSSPPRMHLRATQALRQLLELREHHRPTIVRELVPENVLPPPPPLSLSLRHAQNQHPLFFSLFLISITGFNQVSGGGAPLCSRLRYKLLQLPDGAFQRVPKDVKSQARARHNINIKARCKMTSSLYQLFCDECFFKPQFRIFFVTRQSQ